MTATRLLWATILALFTLAASPADAQMVGNRAVVMLNPQVVPANASAGLPAVDDDLTSGGYPLAGGICAEYGHRVPCNNHYTTTRAQTVSSYCTATDGTLAPVSANVLRLCNGNGALIEEARTNDALWARDMTNAAWVKVGMGTALNATGADGTANSATTLTATGTASSCTASCTALQTITLGSTADTYSVYLMRVTGSGAVNITINNLVGTTACTLTTTAFTRCTVTATLANPVFGIQMVGLNDVIVADFNQLEPGGSALSAIPTTTVAVTRNADNAVASGFLDTFFRQAEETIAARFIVPFTTTNPRIFDNGSGSAVSGATGTQATMTVNGTLASITPNGVTGTTSKVAYSFGASGKSIFLNNDAGNTTSTAGTFTPGTTNIGDSSALTRALNSSLQRLSMWPLRLPDATLKAMTIP